ncbi:MAG: hypothetical protein QOD40_1540, partial [Alphaproteobacteria bacterium]|nr:hypothetical protein [Alphaproteobacteria bacterium]
YIVPFVLSLAILGGRELMLSLRLPAPATPGTIPPTAAAPQVEPVKRKADLV